jgi:arylsulfatase A-like enzyme
MRPFLPCALLLCPTLLADPTPPAPAPPNVLILTIDTWRADYIGASGRGKVKTPHLDALAAQGAYFPETLTCSPMTTPGHATILSGLHPPSHGVRDNTHGKFRDGLPTLATILKAKGYATGAFVSAYPLIRAYGLDRGFDVSDDQLVYQPNKMDFNLQWRPGPATLDRAEAWLKGVKGPFFAWVHLFEPHAPYEAPEPHASAYAKDPYAGEVAYADALAGRLVATLRESGTLDRTLLVVCGDHGEGLGEHGEATHGLLVYQSTLAVPLILRYPGPVQAGVFRQRASLADVAPTVLDLLGVPLPRPVDGTSLKPLLKGTAKTHPPLYAESWNGRLNFGIEPATVWLDGGMKLTMKPRPELYDLDQDASEEANLFGKEAHRPRANALGRALKAWLKPREAGAPAGGTAMVPGLDPNALKSLGYLAGTSTAASAKGMDPVEFLPWMNKIYEARQYTAAAQFDQSKPAYDELLARFPDSAVILLEAGMVGVATRDFPGAKQLFARALAMDGSDPTALLNMGNIEMILGDYRASERHLLHLVELYPSHLEATYNLAGLYVYNIKDRNNGAVWIRKFLALAPDHPDAARMRAVLSQLEKP